MRAAPCALPRGGAREDSGKGRAEALHGQTMCTTTTEKICRGEQMFSFIFLFTCFLKCVRVCACVWAGRRLLLKHQMLFR